MNFISNSFQYCADLCRAELFPYGGVNNGDKCYCSHQINRKGSTTGCTKVCKGDLNSYCGAGNKMHAFQVYPKPYQNGIGMCYFSLSVIPSKHTLNQNDNGMCFDIETSCFVWWDIFVTVW